MQLFPSSVFVSLGEWITRIFFARFSFPKRHGSQRLQSVHLTWNQHRLVYWYTLGVILDYYIITFSSFSSKYYLLTDFLKSINFDFTKIRDMVTESHIGEMRMRFWKETMEQIYKVWIRMDYCKIYISFHFYPLIIMI